MNQRKAYRAMKKTAKEKGISLEELQKEIEAAIVAGMASPDPKAQEFWRSIPKQSTIPTPAEVITYLSRLKWDIF